MPKTWFVIFVNVMHCANTKKLTSPLPDMEGILRWLAHHLYWSLIDGKKAYGQIHMHRSGRHGPHGNGNTRQDMISLVLQQGDAVATYQSLMNHIFRLYIGVFMDIYLDDIMIYSNTLEEHKQHIKLVVDILTGEKLYPSSSKLHFLCHKMNPVDLGCLYVGPACTKL